eukprot:3846034-Amphidinium_carterae.1
MDQNPRATRQLVRRNHMLLCTQAVLLNSSLSLGLEPHRRNGSYRPGVCRALWSLYTLQLTLLLEHTDEHTAFPSALAHCNLMGS